MRCVRQSGQKLLALGEFRGTPEAAGGAQRSGGASGAAAAGGRARAGGGAALWQWPAADGGAAATDEGSRR